MANFDAFYPIINSIPVALAICDPSGRFVGANASYCSLVGYSQEELIGKTIVEMGIITQKLTDQLSAEFGGASGTITEYEMPYVTKTKQTRYAFVSVNPLINEGNRYFIITINDITEKKLAESKSKESRLYLEKITSNVLGMVYEYRLLADGTMLVEFMSNGSKELLGLTSEQLMEDISLLWKIVHPDDMDKLRESMKWSSENDAIWELEYRLRHTDGNYKWISGRSVHQERSANGEVRRIGTLVDISHRKKAEDAQLLSDQRLRQSIELTPNMAVQWYNRKGEIIFWNPASEYLYGYTKHEALGKTLDKLIYSYEDAQQFLSLLQEIERTQIAVGPYETVVHDKNGAPKTILATTFLIPGHTEEPIFVCMDIDISEQKKHEADLIKTNQLLQTLLNSIPVMTCWKDINSVYQGANKLFLEIVNMTSVNELVGKTDEELFGKEWAAKFTEYDQEVFKSGNPKQFYEDPFINKNGHLGWLMKSKTPLKDAAGNVTGILVTGQDVTSRKLIEIALQESEKLLKDVVTNVQAIIYFIDKDGFFTLSEGLALEKMGLMSGEIVGKNVFELYKDYDDILDKIRNALQGNLSESETEFNGIVFSNRYTPSYDERGNLKGIICVSIDITERRKTEDEINHKNEELTKINKELDKFVYSASHDLRAPIASLLGLIELAKVEPNKDEINFYLDKQKITLKKMDEFIHEIVHYSRNGRLAVSKEIIDFRQMVLDLFDQYNYVQKASFVKKELHVQEGITFYSDKQRIGVILSNLISNSLKYADLGKTTPYLNVDIQIMPEKAVIVIKDNGEGIPPEYVDRVFDMFLRATGNSTGSGLGLYIVKEVLEKLQGTIHLRSEFGQWTEFTVTIPNLAKV